MNIFFIPVMMYEMLFLLALILEVVAYDVISVIFYDNYKLEND